MLARRQALSMQERQQTSALFAEKFLLKYGDQKSLIAAYYSIQGELDVLSLLHQLHARGWQCGLPVTPQNHSKTLQFQEWQPDVVLRTGKYSILEPSTDAPIIQPTIILVPLLAYNNEAYRLGYGGGYYDATLPIHPYALTIGCAYQWQLQEFTPEPHDIKLSAVIAV
jgi:5-formyltetrahydrofolate cyclo-ligase